MRRTMMAWLAVGFLAVTIASVLLLCFFNYSICELLKEFCISSIVAALITIPNVIITTHHDRKEIRRKRLMLVQTVSNELRKVQKSCKDVSDETLETIKMSTKKVEVFVSNLMIELSDNQMSNASFEELLEKIENWLRSTKALRKCLEERMGEEAIDEQVNQVDKNFNACMKSIETVVRCAS